MLVSIIRTTIMEVIRNPLFILSGSSWPRDLILYMRAKDGLKNQIGNKNPFASSVLPTQYNLQADGSYQSNVLNMLRNSGFVGAVSGTPGTKPTNWNVYYTGTSQRIVDGDKQTYIAENSRILDYMSISLLANTTYRFFADIEVLQGFTAFQEIILVGTLSGSTRTYILDGAPVANGFANVGVGKHTLGVVVSVGATGGACQFSIGLGVASGSTCTVTISNPQLTEGSIARPYVLSPVSGPALGDVVDVFDGEKWLRSCGAVTNLAVVVPTAYNATFNNGLLYPTETSSVHLVNSTLNLTTGVPYFFSATFKANGVRYAKVIHVNKWQNFDLQDGALSGTSGWDGATIEDVGGGYYRCSAFITPTSELNPVRIVLSPNNTAHWDDIYLGDPTKGVIVRDYQVSQTPYPVPYTPPGTTMPASNATATNGCWFTLADGSPVWKALTGESLTAATRVRMGVGSADFGANIWLNILNQWNVDGSNQLQNAGKNASGDQRIVSSCDGILYANVAGENFNRNSIIRRITQVNTAGTQFRVGYMIEGTHTTIQWSAWVAYDGSFNPSTLYRLMLGYNNKYPMWFNKIAVWNKQMDDAAILEALS